MLASPKNTIKKNRECGDTPVCGERQVGVGTVQNLSGAGMKVDFEGESHAQRKGLQALSGVCVENGTDTKANIGHRQHLRRRGKSN